MEDLSRFGPRKGRAFGLAAALVLSGCAQAGAPSFWPFEPRALSQGSDPKGQGVDGLIVGHRLMEAGEYEMALKAYFRAASENGLDGNTLAAIGSANLALGRLGQAEQVLRRGVEKEPNSVPALNNLGVVLIERGQSGEARRVFERAYALDSGQSDAIRDNLKLAIAQSEGTLYSPPKTPEATFQLVRQDQGRYVLLTEL